MSRIYLDSMVWIYAFESDVRFGAQAQSLLRAVRSRGHTLLASHFCLAELLVYPERDGNAFLSASYRRALRAKEVEIIPFGTRTAVAFAKIRAGNRVSAPDCIHLALASSSNTDLFVTEDVGLLSLSLPGIGKIASLATALSLL